MACKLDDNENGKESDAYESPQELLSHQGAPHILGLNDYCLERILQKLELQDRVRFARTCVQFKTIYEVASARLHKSVNSDELEKCTISEIRDFFKMSGAHVLHIKGMHMKERLAGLVGNQCRNLKTLHVVLWPNMHLYVDSIFDNAYYLEALEICTSSITDENIHVLQNLTNLKILELSDSYITGRTLDKLPVSIEVLKLNCLEFEVSYFPQICKRLTKLRILDILRLTSYKDVFKTMVMDNSCPALEELRFTLEFRWNCEYAAQLPSLKNLMICSDQQLRFHSSLLGQLIDHLVEYNNQKLEHLTIGYRLSKEQLIQVSKLSGLRVLCLCRMDLFDSDYAPIASLRQFAQLNIKLVHGIVDRVRQEIADKNLRRKLPVELLLQCDYQTRIILMSLN
nr:uncharacterized protein LOC108067785 [Drosophila takahashii]